jgi:predicted nucleotidyltransferase
MTEGNLMTGNNDTALVSGTIRKVCQAHGIRIEEMLLFGSRAHRDNREASDYDFIVVTPEPLGHDLKMQLWLQISRTLADLKVTAGILFKSREEYQYDRQNKGKVTYYAVREGIPV